MSCFQCDLEIPHVCYAGMPNARWGLNDSAMEVLEGARRYLNYPAGQKVKVTNAIVDGFHIPEGWTLEALPRSTDHVLLSTPSPGSCMVTIDFKIRGFRTGYSTTSRIVGDEWNKKRKKYGGRNWKQVLVDDAVTYLQGVLR